MRWMVQLGQALPNLQKLPMSPFCSHSPPLRGDHEPNFCGIISLHFSLVFPSELHIPKQQSLVWSALAFYVSGIMYILCLASFVQNYVLSVTLVHSFSMLNSISLYKLTTLFIYFVV